MGQHGEEGAEGERVAGGRPGRSHPEEEGVAARLRPPPGPGVQEGLEGERGGVAGDEEE